MKKKNTLTKEEIIHLAKLANLHLTEEEIKKYQQQLGETLDYIKNLEELSTEKVEPTSQVTDLENVFFEDGVDNLRGLSQEEVLKNTKNKKNSLFVVKRIL